MSSLRYKGFDGTVKYCDIDNVYHGKVTGLPKTCINYHGHTINELEADFRDAIDFYLLPKENKSESIKKELATV